MTIPCGAADAVEVDGITVGLAMLDAVFGEVEAPGPLREEELLRRVKIYNYITRPAEESYAVALLSRLQEEIEKN